MIERPPGAYHFNGARLNDDVEEAQDDEGMRVE